MIAIAQHLVAHVGNVGVDVSWIGPVAGVGLEELVPNHDAVLVAEFVELCAGALAHPVANQVEVGQLVVADLGLHAIPWNALEALIEAPVAAANEDRYAVD